MRLDGRVVVGMVIGIVVSMAAGPLWSFAQRIPDVLPGPGGPSKGSAGPGTPGVDVSPSEEILTPGSLPVLVQGADHPETDPDYLVYDGQQHILVVGDHQAMEHRYQNVAGGIQLLQNGILGPGVVRALPRYTVASFDPVANPAGKGYRPVFQFAYARGDIDNPLPPLDGDVLGDIIWDGYTTSRNLFLGAAMIRVIQTGAAGQTGVPGAFVFRISTPGTTFADIARVDGWTGITGGQTALTLATRLPGSGGLTRLQRVTLGPVNSGGPGKRCLVVEN